MASFPDPEDEPPGVTLRKKVITLAIFAVVLALLCCYGISALEDSMLFSGNYED
jgi:hypothetical protein